MGIPHLTSQIRPYAKPIVWKHRQKDDENVEHLIIDGPSLAYYIYHHCLATKHDARNALEAIPRYQELGHAVIAWLEKIENFGLRVKYICFDGFLPDSKVDTRHDRLGKSLLQLKNFHSLNPFITAKGVTRALLSKTSLDRQRAPTRLTALPAPPFLVPAIIDALLMSHYQHHIRVVPCEAEVHCTSSILGDSDLILTNDSDLILLARNNRVIFFNDLDIQSRPQSDDILSGLYYIAANIGTELDCPDLIQLGFLLKQDPTRSLQDLAKQARQPNSTSDKISAEYAHFRSAFTPQTQYSLFAWAAEGNTTFSSVLSRLDPRVSEFIQEWGAALGNPAFPLLDRSVVPQKSASASRHMFLHFLLDDPTRASAWRASSELRRLAYSILALYGPKFQMLEVDRRGDRILGIHVPLITELPAVVEACRSLLGTLSRASNAARGQSGAEKWSLVALFGVLASLRGEAASLPARADVRRTFDGNLGVKGWAQVHLSAQVEGYIYSLRTLGQFLEVWMAADISHESPDARLVRASLLESLRRLPLLSEVLGRAGGGFVISEVGLQELERGLIEFYGLEGEQESTGQDFVEGKRKKRRRQRTDNSGGRRREKQVSTNMYTLLEDS